MIFCITAGYAQKECDGGDDKPTPDQPHQQDPLDGTATSGGISADPNEIIGPTGYGDSIRWVSINDILNYTILFENDPEFATANAQKVDVRFKFDDKALMKGFGLGTYGFANYSWSIEDSPAAYQNRLDLCDSMFIYVDLLAGLDVVKQEAFWTFNSIDPETGLNPWQVDRGMLPVNDSTHVGEGFVTFHLKPSENLKTGDTISIAANIVFDQNDTIPTNRWCNRIDAGMPTSKVKGKADSKKENLYHLTLQASDDEGGSGLKRVVLYQANNFGIFEEYAICPVDTVIDFEAEPGHQYQFLSLAEDNVGNREPLKEQAELIININAAPTDLVLSDTIFEDDIKAEGFIAELMSEDTEGSTFTYALAEGEGAVHNDLFQIVGSQLQAKQSFKCADVEEYHVRISTTDGGGLTFSKPFVLKMNHVLNRPQPDTLVVSICEGDCYDFHGRAYEQSGTYTYTVNNDYQCDSVYVLQLAVLPRLEAPIVTVEDDCTLVSSVDKGNQWFTADGHVVEGATGKTFTPTEDGIYYVCASNGGCFSAPSNAFKVISGTDFTLSLALNKGWNWISSNLSDAAYTSSLAFVQPLGETVERLIGFDAELIRDPEYGLTGGLKQLSAQEGYMLKLSEVKSHDWTGHAVVPSESSLTLKKGWNWIGYLPMSGLDVKTALADLPASEGDVVKDYTDFCIYEGGEWIGTMEEMRPGAGYMYYSGKDAAFAYPTMHVFPVSLTDEGQRLNALRSGSTWSVAANEYPYNMNVIAALYEGSEKLPANLFTVGAFVGDECRGIGEWVSGTLFLTIYGDLESATPVTFRAIDNATDHEYEIKESALFDNTLVGSVASPFHLTVNGTTGVNEAKAAGYTIYPNPVRDRMYIQGDVAAINSVSVISMSGTKVVQADGYNAKGIAMHEAVPGTYIVVIQTEQGEQVERIIKAAY